MDIETWIADAVAALTGNAIDPANMQERARDAIWTLEQARLNDDPASLGLHGSVTLQFRPELQRAANLDHVYLIQV